MIAAAGVSGLANAFSSAAKAREERRRIAKAQELIGRNLIDDKQLDSMLRDNTRLFNQRLVNTLNQTALRAKGTANAGVAGAQAAGQIEGARATSEMGIRQDVLRSNMGTRTQIAQLGLSGSISDPIGDFVSGAIHGGVAGAQVMRTIKLSEGLNGTDDTTDTFSGTSDIGASGVGDPYTPNYGAVNLSNWMKPKLPEEDFSMGFNQSQYRFL
jgi:hypothetical protein